MIDAIGPLDGRYREEVAALSSIMSEAGLMRARLAVECEYLIALSGAGLGLRKFSVSEKKFLGAFGRTSDKECEIISAIEKKGWNGIGPTDHDVKAAEYFLRYKLKKTSLKDVLPWIHFAITSEDANSLAYGLMLSSALDEVVAPEINKIASALNSLAGKYKNLPMLSRTHGQAASPTTFGKEMKVFAARLERQIAQLRDYRVAVKLNGATGNYNAHTAAHPKTDWIQFSEKFVDGLNKAQNARLVLNKITTQIEPHDTYAELFDNLRRINVILIDFDQDMWRYISDGWVMQKTAAGEVGSSTMPHKVNPIKFENSEGNLGMANALLNHFSAKLPVSRLQRDLSDSTVLRNFGAALGHSLLGYIYVRKGLSRIVPDTHKMREDLAAHPEVVAEAIQTILRREGIADSYEKLKELTRGREITREILEKFIDSLAVSAKVKQELKKITPENYTGLADKIAEL